MFGFKKLLFLKFVGERIEKSIGNEFKFKNEYPFGLSEMYTRWNRKQFSVIIKKVGMHFDIRT